MNLKRKIYYISVLLCACFLLSACGGKASPETTAEIKESSVAETTETTTKATIDEGLKSIGETESEFETKATIRINGKEVSCDKFNRSNYLEILELVIEKGNDWTDLPLSDNFRETYKPEEGVIERKDYTLIYVYDEHEGSFEDGQVRLEVLYEEPKYANSYFDVYFTVNDKEQLDIIEIEFDKEEEIRAEAPIQPIYINVDSCMPMVRFFVQGRREEEQEVEYAITDKFRKYYKDYVGIGLLPDSDYEDLMIVFDLCDYSEKKVVLDAVYADKIIRYNAYFTTDSELRLDSITLEEESVRDREPESKAE